MRRSVLSSTRPIVKGSQRQETAFSGEASLWELIPGVGSFNAGRKAMHSCFN